MKKEDYIKKLRDDETYKDILGRATNSKERMFIQSFTEDFLARIASVIEPLREEYQKDPDGFMKKLEEIDKERI